MDRFSTVVAMSLVTGVILAALACWQSTTRGNRISEINRSGNSAIDIQVMNHFRIVSAVPIVALYIVSVTCALGIPLYFIYVNRLTPQLVLDGTFDEQPQQLSVLPDNLHVHGNSFAIPIAISNEEQQFDVNAGELFAPLTLQTYVDSATQSVYYYVNGVQKYGPFNIDGSAAHIGTIHLSRMPTTVGLK